MKERLLKSADTLIRKDEFEKADPADTHDGWGGVHVGLFRPRSVRRSAEEAMGDGKGRRAYVSAGLREPPEDCPAGRPAESLNFSEGASEIRGTPFRRFTGLGYASAVGFAALKAS